MFVYILIVTEYISNLISNICKYLYGVVYFYRLTAGEFYNSQKVTIFAVHLC
jgi:hypothetical protein